MKSNEQHEPHPKSTNDEQLLDDERQENKMEVIAAEPSDEGKDDTKISSVKAASELSDQETSKPSASSEASNVSQPETCSQHDHEVDKTAACTSLRGVLTSGNSMTEGSLGKISNNGDSEKHEWRQTTNLQVKRYVSEQRKRHCRWGVKNSSHERSGKKDSPTLWGTSEYSKLWDLALKAGENAADAHPMNASLTVVGEDIEDTTPKGLDAIQCLERAPCSDIQVQEAKIDSSTSSQLSEELISPQIQDEQENSEESEWELSFDGNDPMERYTITTVSSGRNE